MDDEHCGQSYVPQPIDTGQVVLPLELHALLEELAENAHEVWASARVSEGWVWGPTRCDQQLHHPCLVRYADLPESEKEYDRAAVLSTLKVVTALGYTIVREPQLPGVT